MFICAECKEPIQGTNCRKYKDDYIHIGACFLNYVWRTKVKQTIEDRKN